MTGIFKLTIPNGGTTSGGVAVNGNRISAVRIPDAFTGATISFEILDRDLGAWAQWVDSTGALKTVTAADGKIVDLNGVFPQPLRGQVRIVSAGAEAAARDLYLHLTEA